MALFPRSGNSLYQIFFHTKDFLWYNWDYEVERYDILGNKVIEYEARVDVTQLSDEESVHGGDVSPRSGRSIEEFSSKVEFQNIMVATGDSIQQQYIMETIIGHQFPLLVVGDTGTGKTRAVKKLIS